MLFVDENVWYCFLVGDFGECGLDVVVVIFLVEFDGFVCGVVGVEEVFGVVVVGVVGFVKDYCFFVCNIFMVNNVLLMVRVGGVYRGVIMY